MSYYRLYRLDRDNRIGEAFEIHCLTDEEADALARARHDGAPMELWNLARLVRRYAPQPGPPGEA